MPRDDWLVGGDRRTIAAERIYAAATELIAREGLDALGIDTLAGRVQCSRATIYRYAGGKAEIRDAVRAERQLVQRFVAPAFTEHRREPIYSSPKAAYSSGRKPAR
jgi:AcrR family transcriptional regulator